jgi:hypothetical protein
VKNEFRKISKSIALVSASTVFGVLCNQAWSASDDIPDLSGVWQWGQCVDGSGIGCMLLEEDDPKLTARAKALRDALDETTQPKYDCAPMSIPHMWTDPYSHQIEQFDDRVVFTYGKDDVVRTAWLPNSNTPYPAVNEFLYWGFSRAHYEGDTLVVVTDKFAFDPQGLNADFKLASSTQKRVTERYSIEDGNLILEVTTEDPVFLREPWVYKTRGRRDEFELALPWNCDAEASRAILQLTPSNYPQDPTVERITYGE